MLRVVEKALQVGLRRAARGKTDLHESWRRCDPGEIAAGEPTIEKAVEIIGIDFGQVRIFPFEAEEKMRIAAEIEKTSDGGSGAIGTDQEAGSNTGLGKNDTAGFAPRLIDAHPATDFSACLAGLIGQP